LVNSLMTWIILIIVAYLLGSIPLSYLAARSRGIDLRKNGTQQVGGGNLWRTTSRSLGLMVGIFDFFKGMLMVLIAWRLRMDAGQQLAVGIIIILPLINDSITPWPSVAFFIAAIIVIIFTHRTPVPILVGMVMLPVISGVLREPVSVTLGFLAMALMVIIKRLTAQPATEASKIGMGRLIWNRLLHDRDIADRKAWVHRRHVAKKEQQGDGG
jgi:glycerol-3-phosphate acyltransferase PlsY